MPARAQAGASRGPSAQACSMSRTRVWRSSRRVMRPRRRGRPPTIFCEHEQGGRFGQGLVLAMELAFQLLDPPAILAGLRCAGRAGLAKTGDRILLPGIQLRRIQPLLATPGAPRRLIHRRRDDHRLQPCRCCPALAAGNPSAKASARQRSNVAVLIPTSRDTSATDELSGGNSLATIRSLYACPYRATS